MSGVFGGGADIYARARLRFPLVITGTNAIVSNALPSGFQTLTDGLSFTFISSGANTGAVTLDIGNGTARSVKREDGNALTAGDIPAAGYQVEVIYRSADDTFRAMIGGSSISGGQIWQNVIGSRAANTNYTNTSGKPRTVCVSAVYGGSGSYMNGLTDNGVILGKSGSNNASVDRGTITFIVPNNGNYQVQVTAGVTIEYWAEF